MSKYRASMTYGSRKGGQSASAKHKYQNREDLYLVGKEGVRDDLAASGSGNLPAFAQGNAGAYWLAVDSFERADGRLYTSFELNLPRELTLEQQKAAVQSYMKSICDKEKLTYSWVIHHPKNGENPHAHVMINERKNDAFDRPAEQHFMRWNGKHPERGGAQKSRSLQPRRWLMHARAEWAIAANDALESAGHKRHFDHRTLAEQRISALLAKDWRKSAELDRTVCVHEGPRVAGVRRKYEAGKIDSLPEYAREVIESNNAIKALNASHLDTVASMSDGELELMEREAYFDALAEREPERLDAEIEQLHSEALELDALHDAHSEALELDALHDAHSEALEIDALHDAHSEALKIDALHDAHSEALEIDALHDAHSEALEIDALHDAHSEALELDALHDAHSEALELDALHDAHSEALEIDALHDAQLEPAPQAAHLLKDEGMIAQETLTFKQKQQSALAALRAEKAAQLVQSEPAPQAEPEPALQPAAEPQPAPELEAQDAELEALELEDVVRRIEQIDLSVENQRIQKSTYSIKAQHIKEDYQALKRQQNALLADEARQPFAFKMWNKFLKIIGFKSDSELLEPELKRLSAEFSIAKNEREHAQSQLTSLKKERDELMQLDISEPLRKAVRQREAARSDANDAFTLARETLRESKIDKSSRYYIERDLQMIRQDLNADDYTAEDMQLVQQRLAELVDTVNDEVQKQIARQQHSQRPQSQPQPQDSQRPRSGPRL